MTGGTDGAAAPAVCEVLVVGAYYADLVFRDLPAAPRAGAEVFAGGFDLQAGGAFTLAMALHRLGRAVVWCTDLGTDEFSAWVLAAARREGLDEAGFRHHRAPVRSVTVALSSAADRSMISFQDPVEPASVPALLHRHRPRLLVLPLLRSGPDIDAALRAARRIGARVLMACQDVPATLDDPAVRATLALVDVFVPNDAEALRLTGATDVDAAGRDLARLAGTVVVTRGPAGAVAYSGGQRHECAAVSVEVVDTTAAGDCSTAGFAHALLGGAPLAECLAVAMACGAAAVTGPGSAAAPTLRELPRWLDRSPHR